MTDFFRICCITAIGSAVLLIFVGKERELTSLITALLLVTVFLHAAEYFGELISPWKVFLQKTFPQYAEIFLSIVGITLGGATATEVCDAVGQKGLSGLLEFLTVLEIILIASSPLWDILSGFLTVLTE